MNGWKCTLGQHHTSSGAAAEVETKAVRWQGQYDTLRTPCVPLFSHPQHAFSETESEASAVRNEIRMDEACKRDDDKG